MLKLTLLMDNVTDRLLPNPYPFVTRVLSLQGSSEHRYKIVAVPIELEVSGELDSFVKHEILDEYGLTYPKWIQQCYIERMQQILSDPAEFGKVVLERKKSDHCVQNADDIEDC